MGLARVELAYTFDLTLDQFPSRSGYTDPNGRIGIRTQEFLRKWILSPSHSARLCYSPKWVCQDLNLKCFLVMRSKRTAVNRVLLHTQAITVGIEPTSSQ